MSQTENKNLSMELDMPMIMAHLTIENPELKDKETANGYESDQKGFWISKSAFYKLLECLNVLALKGGAVKHESTPFDPNVSLYKSITALERCNSFENLTCSVPLPGRITAPKRCNSHSNKPITHFCTTLRDDITERLKALEEALEDINKSKNILLENLKMIEEDIVETEKLANQNKLTYICHEGTDEVAHQNKLSKSLERDTKRTLNDVNALSKSNRRSFKLQKPTDEEPIEAKISAATCNSKSDKISRTRVEVMVLESNASYSLREFDGRPDVDFKTWIRHITDILEAQIPALDNDLKIRKLKAMLVGRARDEFDTLTIGNTTTYQQVVDALKPKFEHPESRGLALAQLSMMEKRQTFEELIPFIDRFEKTVKQATIGLAPAVLKQKLLDEFLLKLDPQLAFHVRMEDPQDYEKAVTIAKKMDALLKLKAMDTVRAQIASVEPIGGPSRVEQLVDRLCEHLQIMNTQENEGEEHNGEESHYQEGEDYDDDYQEEFQVNGNPICYYCRMPGHIARNCYQQRQDDYIQDRHNEIEELKAENQRLQDMLNTRK